MKRYVHSTKETNIQAIKLNFTAEVVVGPVYKDSIDYDIAAAIHEVPDKVPRSPLPHVEKRIKLGPQALADYNAFIDSAVELMTDYYELKIYYENKSKDESHYYTCLAKDDSGELIVDFKVKIRLANHDAHESKAADYNKKQEKEAGKQLVGDVKLKPLYIHLILNDENEDVSTYDEAYLWFDERLEEKVKIMRRRLKYRK